MSIDFTIKLGAEDWDATVNGWRCPALKIPGATVAALFTQDGRADKAFYEVQAGITTIRWVRDARPPTQVTVALALTEELSTEDLTARWRKLSIVLPVLATIATSLIAAQSTKPSHEHAAVCDMWTIDGTVNIPAGLSVHDFELSIKPPDLDLRPGGLFKVSVPIQTHADGTLEPTELIFTPMKAGYSQPIVLLDRVGAQHLSLRQYSQTFDDKNHFVHITSPIDLEPAARGYSPEAAQQPKPVNDALPPTPTPAAVIAQPLSHATDK